MKTDINGCSTTAAGQEHHESYYSPILRMRMIQYDYRTADGELFSCCAPNLGVARERRDKWLEPRRMDIELPTGEPITVMRSEVLKSADGVLTYRGDTVTEIS